MPAKQANHLNMGALIYEKLYIFCCFSMVAALCLSIVLPLLHVLAASFSDPRSIVLGKVLIWPVGFRTTAYKNIILMPEIWRGYYNSAIYILSDVCVSIIMVILIAYPLSRKEFRARTFIISLLTITIVFKAGIIPLYLVIMKLGLLNSVWSLVLPGSVVAFNVFMMTNYIKTNISEEMLEAAEMDGCSHFRYLTRVVIPLSRPIMAVLVLWIAVSQWNSYFPALMYFTDSRKSPLQLVLVRLLLNLSNDYTANMSYLLRYALLVFSMLPMLVLYPFIQRFFIKGIMVGSLKG
jgi:putative aldouronate transport system permease protein